MTINNPGHRARWDPQPVPRNWLAGVPGNPLARREDRQQVGLRRLCGVIWILALPLAVLVGVLIVSAGVHAASVQARDRTPATAVLLADAPRASLTTTGAAITVSTDVAARWSAPDGSARTGVVSANSGARAGAKFPIWVDTAGSPVSAPVTAGAAIGVGIGLGGGSWVLVGVLLMMIFRLRVQTLDRRRRKDLDREWAQVAPLWLRLE